MINAMFYYLNGWNKPLTPTEFTGMFGIADTKEEQELIKKYLVLCKDGLIRVRSRSLINDWHVRYTAYIQGNWAALGIAHAG